MGRRGDSQAKIDTPRGKILLVLQDDPIIGFTHLSHTLTCTHSNTIALASHHQTISTSTFGETDLSPPLSYPFLERILRVL